MIPETNTEVVQPSAVEAITRGEIDIAISTARRYPRQLAAVKQSMMSFATLDEETAASCFYTLPRGGKTIQGPSVRLAEIALSCYGNLRAAARVINTVTSGENPHVMIQAVAFDLEKNISISIEKRRRIIGKKSKGGMIDEDDINLATNACSAIAFRDAVFKVVPLALIKPVFEAARKVAVGDAKTLSDRRAKCIDTFAKMGVQKDAVLRRLEKKSVEDIDLADIELMIGLHNAIREGEVKVDEAFPPQAKTEGNVPQMPGVTVPVPQAPPVQAPATSTATKQQPPPPEAAGTVTQAPVVTCHYCKQTVADMAAHNCPEMQAALTERQAASDKAGAANPPPQPTPPPSGDEGNDALASIAMLCEQSEIKTDTVMAFAKKNKLAKDTQAQLSELATSKLKGLIKNWPNILPELRQIQGQGEPVA